MLSFIRNMRINSPGGWMGKTLEIRFWEKVKRGGYHECWEWQAYKNACGYGVMAKDGKSQRAPRIAWEIHNGSINSKLSVLHKCDNRSCVNPNHLYLGTQAENMRDMVQRGRHGLCSLENNANSKLNKQMVKEIRQLYKPKPFTQRELAKRFGVSQRLISLVVRNEIWPDEAL